MSSAGKPVGVITWGFILALILGCTPVASPTINPASSVELAPAMEIGIVTTTLGGLVSRDRVDLSVPGGGTLITIEAIEPGKSVTISWRRTVERQVPPKGPTAAVGIGTPTPTPVTEIVTESGTITANGVDDAHAALLPLYWPSLKTTTTDTSLMWLSEQAFEQLKRDRQTQWSADALTAFSNLPIQAIEHISEATKERELSLNAEPDLIDFDIAVNREKTRFQAIRALDDFGNEYIILDQAENPLILRSRFNVVSTGAIGIDVGTWARVKAVFSGYQVVEIRQ